MKTMKIHGRKLVLGLLLAAALATEAVAITLTNPIVFVTQPPIPRELNSSITNTFLSVVTIFGNHLPDTAHCARGGDLWLMMPNTNLLNLTRRAGFGTNGVQDGVGIAVRDPKVNWDGKKIIFSMVVGAPTGPSDTNKFYWQMYECTNLAAVIANTNTPPAIVRVPNQPANFNNVNPCYGLNGRIIFACDKPYRDQPHLYPALDEYKGHPTVTGIYSLDPVANDLRMLIHTPSGAFHPLVDSFGRGIATRWDHLSQDPVAQDDRLGRATNGAFTFASELPGAATNYNLLELFPEPRNFDTNQLGLLGVSGNSFNNFFPWQFDAVLGGDEEIINHWGRHEFVGAMSKSFTNDANLVSFNSVATRAASGVISANTNFFVGLFHITEDPRTNGLYWGTSSPDISVQGGHHSGGAILTLMGPPSLNPTGMFATYITPSAGASGPGANGLYRDPLPMSDGLLLAVHTPTPTALSNGWDFNVGTVTNPVSQHHFRIYNLTNGGGTYTAATTLTGGLTNHSIYWDGAIQVTNQGTMWELQPVEVRSRMVPVPPPAAVSPVEQLVFAQELVDLATMQVDLVQRELALFISRDVTARDAADKQQPYNLFVPGGTNSIANGGKAYAITHLTFLEADYLRGYTHGTTNIQPGRRTLVTPMSGVAAFNYPSSKPNAPVGGTELMSDGSQATIVPANRALTWHLTGTNGNDSVTKERYELGARAGEIRTCANCHGINSKDQLGRTSPTNAPLALRKLLQLWRTNSANAYSLTVGNGTGGGAGQWGAGSILTLTANTAAPGQAFSQWTGPGISNAALPTTSFIMPATNAVVAAVFTNLPAPQFQLTVNSGSGSGSYTQGTLVTITASNAPGGQYFARWTGAAVSNAAAPLTFLLMPAMPTNVTVIYSNVPPIQIAAPSGGFGNSFTISAAGIPGLNYSVFASTNLTTTNNWRLVGTTTAAPNGAILFSTTNAASLPQQFIQIRHP